MKKFFSKIKNIFTKREIEIKETSDPYILEYENTSDKDTTAVLFGFNDYNGVENFGNPKEVIITSLQGGTYRRLFNQSNNKPFMIGEWRFVSSNPYQMNQTLKHFIVDANGCIIEKPMNLTVLKDIYQYANDTITDKSKTIIDANTFFTFPLKANTKFVISMYPIKIFSLTDFIRDDLKANQYILPSIDGYNTYPVIIPYRIEIVYSTIKSWFKNLFTKKQS